LGLLFVDGELVELVEEACVYLRREALELCEVTASIWGFGGGRCCACEWLVGVTGGRTTGSLPGVVMFEAGPCGSCCGIASPPEGRISATSAATSNQHPEIRFRSKPTY